MSFHSDHDLKGQHKKCDMMVCLWIMWHANRFISKIDHPSEQKPPCLQQEDGFCQRAVCKSISVAQNQMTYSSLKKHNFDLAVEQTFVMEIVI